MADTTDRRTPRDTNAIDNDMTAISDACRIDSSDDPIYVKTERTCSEDQQLGNIQGYDLSVTSSAGTVNPEGHSSDITSPDLTKSLVVLMDNKWTAPATGRLLELYKQNEERFNNPHIKKKLLWREISEKLNSEGFMFDADKCERKFLNLKTTYRYTVDHNMQTGNQKRCAFYEQLDNIFRFQISRDSPFTNRSSHGDEFVDDTLNRRVVPVSLTMCDRGNSSHTRSDLSQMGSRQNTSIEPNVNFMTGSDTLVVSMDTHSSQRSSNRTVPQSNRNPIKTTDREFYPVDTTKQNLNINRSQFASHQQVQFSQGQGNRQRNLPQNFSDSRIPSTQNRERHASRYAEDDDSSRELPSSSGLDRSDDNDFTGKQRNRKRKHSELSNLLATFEKYREEQRQREEQRMNCMKEWHDEEMKVMNRFLDIIQQSMQSGNDN